MLNKLFPAAPLCLALLAAQPAQAAAPDAHPAVKRPFNLPPSVQLDYAITAQQSGLTLGGEGTVKWQAGGGKYSTSADTRAGLFGKILDTSSEGMIDAYGLAPAHFAEKRFRKDATTTSFNRDARTITFTQSGASFPLAGGEQDRTSIVWQLIAVARAAPKRFTNGSTWDFFVAGQRDAQSWTFKVVGREKIDTPLGKMEAVHVLRAPPPDDPGQRLELWLAPSREWYPLRLRFTDPDGDFVEQTLNTITKVAP